MWRLNKLVDMGEPIGKVRVSYTQGKGYIEIESTNPELEKEDMDRLHDMLVDFAISSSPPRSW